METVVGVFAVLYLIVIFMLLFALLIVLYGYIIVTYILEGKALSAIARRRGLEKPWLAWVPVGKFWLLGAISDQYRYVAHGQIRNRRKLLLWTDIVFVALTTVFTAGVEIWAVSTVMTMVSQGSDDVMAVYFGGIAVIYLLLFAYIGIAAVISVFQYMAYYDLFRSCDPGKSLVYLLVSIFTTYPLPFFVYSCRDKDLGMPPRMDVSASSGE